MFHHRFEPGGPLAPSFLVYPFSTVEHVGSFKDSVQQKEIVADAHLLP